MVLPGEKKIIPFVNGILNSYSQIFFSKNKVFALILIGVTFFDWFAGLSGLVAVIITNTFALRMGYNRNSVSEGYYGFNSLLVGLGLGIYYQPGFAFLFLLIFAILFTFFINIWLENYFGKYGLPYLAWPFLISIWMVSLAARQFASLEVSERGLYMLNEMYDYGGPLMVDTYHYINKLPIHESILIYFQSLGAIFFQYHLLAGVLIAIGLLIYSRIAFLLSVLGFFSAYYYYLFMGANLGELSYGYIGFNYILTAIAIGGFFIIPSKHSFLWVFLLTPMTSIIITSTSTFFQYLNLPIYSLAFNLIVLLFVYVLKFRERNFSHPELVAVQQFSPEKNLYTQNNYKSRFDVTGQDIQIHLPFWGEMQVTQAHNGEHTHRGDWKQAWDFEILDEQGKQFTDSGLMPEDYLCYNQAVIAPADAVVQEIQDGIEDNAIGNINLEKNWGNTIVIKHAEKLYSKVSHLKKESIVVKVGDEIKRGEMMAKVGNSGRSPVPHLHFQLQEDPFIGSKTLDYPISKYLRKEKNSLQLETFERPLKGQLVSSITKNESLFKAFNFISGQTVSFEFTINDDELQSESWEVKTDYFNNSYLWCKSTSSKAWFKNDGTLFYFTHFTGDNDSLLYYFYLGTYKVALGFYKNLTVRDEFPIAILKNSFLRFWQDFLAPFYIFMRAGFSLNYIKMEDDLSSSSILMHSEAHLQYSGRSGKETTFEIFVEDNRIKKFNVEASSFKLEAKEVKS